MDHDLENSNKATCWSVSSVTFACQLPQSEKIPEAQRHFTKTDPQGIMGKISCASKQLEWSKNDNVRTKTKLIAARQSICALEENVGTTWKNAKTTYVAES